jgi:transposase
LSGEFQGYLQFDEHASYASVAAGCEGITHVLCWDHARRYFFDAFQQIPKDKRANSTADRVLKLIGKLYKVEERTKGVSSPDARLKVR